MKNKRDIQQCNTTTCHSTLSAGWLRRTLVWLRRIGHCRGFGVQSPWAYSMVRYVINERYPYYAFAPLAAKYRRQGRVKRKLGELYLRLANSVQPSAVVDFCDDADDAFWEYVSAGCRKAKHVEARRMGCDEPEIIGALPAEGAVMVRLRMSEQPPLYINKVWQAAKSGWVIIVEDIHRSSKARQQWREWGEERSDVVTFDLYYCGLVFFDDKRYKQNYIINF